MDDLKTSIDEEIQIINEMLSSEDPVTRIKARRMRLSKNDALSRTREHTPKLTPSEIQLKTSSDIIAELLDDTQFSITNVRRAAVKKEGLRQDENKIEREGVKELISKEAEIAEQKFQIIDSQWLGISLEKDPLNIHGSTEDQREKCVDLLEQKDSVIDELKLKSKEADSNFFEELLQQNQYVNILIDRINDQINLMTRSYREELKTLENVIESERNNLIGERGKQWDDLASEKEELELDNIKKRYDLIDQYALDLDSTLVQLHEKMRKTRIDCQNEIQDFSLELDSLNNACLINSEKLHYNFHVLQIRRDENYEMKSLQKRALNRLQDQITSLKETRTKRVKIIKNEIAKLRKDLLKTTENMADTRRRHVMLASSGDKKFFKLWDYNQQIAEARIKELFEADKCFHEELFGRNWEPPNEIDFKKESMQSYVEAVNFTKGEKDFVKLKLSKNDDVEKVLKALLISMGENDDILMDDALEQIAASLTVPDRLLVIADKLFKLLGVSSTGDAHLLAQTFAPYVQCATCNESDSSGFKPDDERVLDLIDQTVRSQIDLMASMSSNLKVTRSASVDEEMSSPELSEMIGDKPTFELIQTFGLCSKPGHRMIIDPQVFSKALNEFIMKINERSNSSSIASLKPSSISRSLNQDEIKLFWRQFTSVFDDTKMETWKALLSHMKEYYKLLLKRQFYCESIKKLKSSNLDLRRLLQRNVKPKDLTARQLEIDLKFRSAIFDPPMKCVSSLDLS